MKKLLFFVTEDWYFLSHRLPMAEKAKELGFDVCLATKINDENTKKEIENKGYKVIPINLNRSGKNIIKELKSLFEIIKIYKNHKPDMVHHVALKPSLYGSFASIIMRTPFVINALAGMGSVFTDQNLKCKILKPIITFAFRFLFNRKNSKLIVQNDDDFNFFAKNKILKKENIIKIKGSGVDIDKFEPKPEILSEVIVVSLVSRMLWNKGIGEAVGAAKILKNHNVKIKLRLIGDPDPLNPQSIDIKDLRQWHENEIIEYIPHQNDIQKIWNESHIAILPSYREGLPKSLLEAGACAKAIITTDVPGCRELIKDGINGLIVPAKNTDDLATAIKKLAQNPALREKLGKNARDIIVEEYSSSVIAKEVGKIYSLPYNKTKDKI